MINRIVKWTVPNREMFEGLSLQKSLQILVKINLLNKLKINLFNF